jgi:hypothetical protein
MEDITKIAEEVENLHGNMTTVMSDVKEIREALLGNNYTKNAGLVNTVSEHHLRLTTIEKQLEKGKWLLVGLSAGSGIGIYEILKNFS